MPDTPMSPREPPGSIGYGTLFTLLPGNLQIMVVVFPLLMVAGVLWVTLSPNHHSGKVLFVVTVMFSVYVVLIELHRRKLQRYQQVAGTITEITAGNIMERRHL
jgi:membrane protein YdbS with pleckstrin-like domain